MKLGKNLLLLSLLNFTNAMLGIKFVDDLCFMKKAITVDLRYENTGILMGLPRQPSGDSTYCRMRLIAHEGSSVVLSIYRYNISSQDQLTIQDSDKHTISLIGAALFKDEKKSIISPGEMIIIYERNKRSWTSGFQFTFTQVHESPCMANEFACKNGKCILKELACNGHNHCGDNSDNLKCALEFPIKISSKSTNYPSVWLVSLAVVLFIMTVALLAVIIRSSRRLKPNSPIDDSRGNSSNAPIPLQSISSSVPVSNAHSSSTDQRQISATLYDRVRRSLRRNNNSREEEVRVHREIHEVPSMYPNLSELPTAPELEGVDNGAYKNEE